MLGSIKPSSEPGTSPNPPSVPCRCGAGNTAPASRDRILPFETHAHRYEAWFAQHEAAYRSELAAIKPFVDAPREGLEVGVGTGRFAEPLNVSYGVEPAKAMARIAHQRGIRTVQGIGEALPFTADAFDLVLIVVTLCFLTNPDKAIREARRVLAPNGRLVVGFLDRDQPWGMYHEDRRHKNPFYANATFYNEAETRNLLERNGFHIKRARQALFGEPGDLRQVETPREGTGDGSFLSLDARIET